MAENKTDYYWTHREECKRKVKEYQNSIPDYKAKQKAYNQMYYRKGKTGKYANTIRTRQPSIPVIRKGKTNPELLAKVAPAGITEFTELPAKCFTVTEIEWS